LLSVFSGGADTQLKALYDNTTATVHHTSSTNTCGCDWHIQRGAKAVVSLYARNPLPPQCVPLLSPLKLPLWLLSPSLSPGNEHLAATAVAQEHMLLLTPPLSSSPGSPTMAMLTPAVAMPRYAARMLPLLHLRPGATSTPTTPAVGVGGALGTRALSREEGERLVRLNVKYQVWFPVLCGGMY
jgi:hypothetical protein